MIFARDKGRMCNNILQYGHVYAWAREHGRKSVAMRFCYKYQYFNICSTKHHHFFTYLAVKWISQCGFIPVVGFHEPNNDTAEKENQMLLTNNIVVEGWYVRFYDLFLKYKQEIINLFSFKKNIRDTITSYLTENTSQNELNLGVHIRRGDYKTWKGGLYYFSDDTYIGYIRRFAELHNNHKINVFICGNDPSLNQKEYHKQLSGLNIYFPNGNPAEDLCLLSECDYIMGAPSTFSLVASIYHNRPLMWIYNKDYVGNKLEFSDFDTLFKHIE